MKNRITDWEKTFGKHLSDKGFVPRTCKELSKRNNKNKHIDLKKGKRSVQRQFINEDIQMTNKHMQNTQHCQSPGKWKLKPQDITTYLLEWVSYQVLMRMWRDQNSHTLLVGI